MELTVYYQDIFKGNEIKKVESVVHAEIPHGGAKFS